MSQRHLKCRCSIVKIPFYHTHACFLEHVFLVNDISCLFSCKSHRHIFLFESHFQTTFLLGQSFSVYLKAIFFFYSCSYNPTSHYSYCPSSLLQQSTHYPLPNSASFQSIPNTIIAVRFTKVCSYNTYPLKQSWFSNPLRPQEAPFMWPQVLHPALSTSPSFCIMFLCSSYNWSPFKVLSIQDPSATAPFSQLPSVAWKALHHISSLRVSIQVSGFSFS